MKLLFWVCFSSVAYTYFGYAVWLYFVNRVRRLPTIRSPIVPFVSIVMAVRNEEANLRAKLDNLLHLNYPQDCLQIIVVSDGSTDRTSEILGGYAARVLTILLEKSHGKAYALNMAMKQATGEMIVFMDVRQIVDLDAISELAVCFADPDVGAVSGELLLESNADSSSSDALGLYWKIEKLVRRLESASGSVVGVTGALYAIRRVLYTEIPEGTILDDVFVPMQIVRLGKRVVFQGTAIARDRIFGDKGKEFSRKVRTLTGNYQLLRLAPWLLTTSNPLLFRFISHKVLRLLAPLLLILMLVTSGVSDGALFRALFYSQILFYLLALLGIFRPIRRFKMVAIANTFVMLNAAAAFAFVNFAKGRNSVWK